LLLFERSAGCLAPRTGQLPSESRPHNNPPSPGRHPHTRQPRIIATDPPMPLVEATEHHSANYLLPGASFCSIPPAEKNLVLNFFQLKDLGDASNLCHGIRRINCERVPRRPFSCPGTSGNGDLARRNWPPRLASRFVHRGGARQTGLYFPSARTGVDAGCGGLSAGLRNEAEGPNALPAPRPYGPPNFALVR
jgi:hypothetical protein